jgi:hypothetical protein
MFLEVRAVIWWPKDAGLEVKFYGQRADNIPGGRKLVQPEWRRIPDRFDYEVVFLDVEQFLTEVQD